MLFDLSEARTGKKRDKPLLATFLATAYTALEFLCERMADELGKSRAEYRRLEREEAADLVEGTLYARYAALMPCPDLRADHVNRLDALRLSVGRKLSLRA